MGMNTHLGGAVDLTQFSSQELQTCNECGRNFTAGQKMVFCPQCHIKMEILMLHNLRQYQRWGVLAY